MNLHALSAVIHLCSLAVIASLLWRVRRLERHVHDLAGDVLSTVTAVRAAVGLLSGRPRPPAPPPPAS